jgi:hypothetical protein
VDLFSNNCLDYGSNQVKVRSRYQTVQNGERRIHHRQNCDAYFSDTVSTPIARLQTALSRVIQILTARSEGIGLNATARTFKVSKKSIIDWEWRLSSLKPTLLLYSLAHQFLEQIIEGDELHQSRQKHRCL